MPKKSRHLQAALSLWQERGSLPLSRSALNALRSAVPHALVPLSARTLWCSRCGTRIPREELATDGTATCPHCSQTLPALCKTSRSYSRGFYAQQLLLWRGCQVIRTFFCSYSACLPSSRRQDSFLPVFNAFHTYDWIVFPDGERFCFSLPVIGQFATRALSPWSLNSTLRLVRNPSAGGKWRQGWDIDTFLPRAHIAPWAARRGLSPSALPSWDRFELLRGTFDCPHFETALKMRSPQLCSLLLYRHGTELWPQIKIALRAGFDFSDTQLWTDHIRLLQRLGMDISNPRLIAPPDLNAAHEKASRLLEKKREKDRANDLSEHNRAYLARLGQAAGASFRFGNLTVRVLSSVHDFLIESKTLHHCAFACAYYDKPSSVIVSVCDGPKRCETAEIDIPSASVIQCRGEYNLPSPLHDSALLAVSSAIPSILSLLPYSTLHPESVSVE